MKGNSFFDLDGTVANPREGIVRCLRHALDQLGVAAPDDEVLARYIGPPLHDGFAELLGESRQHLIGAAVAHYRERFGTLGMYENAIYPGMPQALSTLREAGFKLWIVTSKPTFFARPILEHFGLAHHFEGIYGSELSGERGDKRALLAHVLATEHLSPESGVMIGDRSHDVLAAQANRVPSIGVLWGFGSREELEAAGADRLYASIPELTSALLDF